jgi:outer membrane protein assembly factor BamE (lipoprotein component of BamABCDE complex)
MANPFEDLDKPDPVPARSRGRSARRKLKPHKGQLLLSLGILSFLVPLIAAPITWLMARSDLKEMDAGRMDPSGRPQTKTASRLAIVSMLLWSFCLLCGLGYQMLEGGVLISAVGSRRISKAEFDRVQSGMTKKQVIDILGQPARTGYRDGRLNWYWHERNGRATFVLDFDDHERVRDLGWDTPD